MAERKVFQKYYPPDFDWRKLPRTKKKKLGQHKVRTMLPMTICCTGCGEFLYQGKKFNARKETVEGEDYLGIKIFRFYIKCTRCKAELTFKTDPKNNDYAVEHGATRNFDPWKAEANEKADVVQKRADEEEGDAMKALENRTLDSKRERDIMDALDELKSLKARQALLDTDELFEAQRRRAEEARARHKDLTDAELDELQAFAAARAGGTVRRLSDDDADDALLDEHPLRWASPSKRPHEQQTDSTVDADELSGVGADLLSVLDSDEDQASMQSASARPSKRPRTATVAPVCVVARQKVDVCSTEASNRGQEEVEEVNALNLLGYGSSDSD
mmetsp:Transcript_46943/g.118301  ORF Transcript_46943/g.118301 Transcript_46943/m.118301 type:complete len:331 (-) Transcript_46943:50-1042(-)